MCLPIKIWSVVGECCSLLCAQSQGCIQIGLQPSPSYQAAVRETMSLFILTLTHGHPHHHRNQRRGIHPNSLISVSVPLADTNPPRRGGKRTSYDGVIIPTRKKNNPLAPLWIYVHLCQNMKFGLELS